MNYRSIKYGFATLLIVVGAMFRIMHWPFGQELMSAGMVLGIVFLMTHIKREKQKFK
tara:strand:- start:7874 stop:8044 length:171 start_codon:yes stop_codon:yes gene_type:complete